MAETVAMTAESKIMLMKLAGETLQVLLERTRLFAQAAREPSETEQYANAAERISSVLLDLSDI